MILLDAAPEVNRTDADADCGLDFSADFGLSDAPTPEDSLSHSMGLTFSASEWEALTDHHAWLGDVLNGLADDAAALDAYQRGLIFA